MLPPPDGGGGLLHGGAWLLSSQRRSVPLRAHEPLGIRPIRPLGGWGRTAVALLVPPGLLHPARRSYHSPFPSLKLRDGGLDGAATEASRGDLQEGRGRWGCHVAKWQFSAAAGVVDPAALVKSLVCTEITIQ